MQSSGLAQDLLSLASGVGPEDLQGVLVSLAVRATSHGGEGMASQVSSQSTGWPPASQGPGQCSVLSQEEAVPSLRDLACS